MLLFLDQAKAIRVVRTTVGDDGSATRERLGIIQKANFDVGDELKTALTSEELQETEDVVSFFKLSGGMSLKYKAAQFPQLAREMVEYMSNGASATERHLVVTALMEAIRQVRKLEREHKI